MTWKKAGSSSGTRTNVRAPAARRGVHRRAASSAAGRRRSLGSVRNRTKALFFCFDAFSSREPVPTSLETLCNRAWQNRVGAVALASRLQMRPEQEIVHLRIVLGATLE